jgi:hypothetical protein
MAQQPKPAGLSYPYVDLPELSETFADSIQGLFFDGQTARITFVVNRPDPAKPPTANAGSRIPVCRLVLTANCTIELADQLGQLAAAMAQAQAGAPGGRSN